MRQTEPASDYFHKVVDCQWACPAHTPVPQYIDLIARKQFTEAYLVNWRANVFPGILGRTCDRPCEPACRRGRVDKEPVAICRLKRAAADNKQNISEHLPQPAARNGKRVAFVGGGPASLSAARDLNLAGYECVVFDKEQKAGGMVRTRIPHFRIPETVIDEEAGYVLNYGVAFARRNVTSLKTLLEEPFDAIFVGTGAPRGLDLDIPGRDICAKQIHIASDWLANVSFKHINRIGKRVVVIGGGNTALDCARTARRIGGQSVTVVYRGTRAQMRAALWEQEDAERENIRIVELLSPKCFIHHDNKLIAVDFNRLQSNIEGGERKFVRADAKAELIECDDVILAIGQESAFPWIERDIGLSFNEHDRPTVDPQTMQSSLPNVFFGGDAAFGSKNIITTVAQGREAAISIDLFLKGKALGYRPQPDVYWKHGEIRRLAVPPKAPELSAERRHPAPHISNAAAFAEIESEVETGFDLEHALAEAKRCLQCQTQTIYETALCVECKACEQVCPTQCITFTKNGEEDDLRDRLSPPAQNKEQALLVGGDLISGRVMIKNEDLCLHCGLCAENCPTNAWHMEDFLLLAAHASEFRTSVPAAEERADV